MVPAPWTIYDASVYILSPHHFELGLVLVFIFLVFITLNSINLCAPLPSPHCTIAHVGLSVPFLGLLRPCAHFNLSVHPTSLRQPIVVHVLYLPPPLLPPLYTLIQLLEGCKNQVIHISMSFWCPFTSLLPFFLVCLFWNSCWIV